MRTCPCCNEPNDSLVAVMSVLDFSQRRMCMTCFDENAEPASVVLAAQNRELLASVTVFDAASGEYVLASQWLADYQPEEASDAA